MGEIVNKRSPEGGYSNFFPATYYIALCIMSFPKFKLATVQFEPNGTMKPAERFKWFGSSLYQFNSFWFKWFYGLGLTLNNFLKHFLNILSLN